jgi:hypothetical protein
MTYYEGLDIPVGAIMPCIDLNFTNLADSWIICDGASLSRTEYSALYSVIGTKYGSVNSSSFSLPNLINRIPISSDTTKTLGSYGGSNTYTLSGNNLPKHRHGFTQGAHVHYYNPEIKGDDFNNQGGNGGYYTKTLAARGGDSSRVWNPTSGYSGTTGKNTGYKGSGVAFSVIPSSFKVLFIIKT